MRIIILLLKVLCANLGTLLLPSRHMPIHCSFTDTCCYSFWYPYVILAKLFKRRLAQIFC